MPANGKKTIYWVPTQLSGFVCAYHPAALGLSLKHTIYVFTIYSQISAIFVLHCENNENEQKMQGLAHLK